jgi:coenzyme F420-0:L-glutamate ligase/coenzyme F420-1:gamma-L-glutamate ligase
MNAFPDLRVVGITGLPEVTAGSDFVGLLLEGLARQDLRLRDRDILVITQKVVSKSEGRLVRLSTVTPSSLAESFAQDGDRDPRSIEVVLSESRRIVKMDRGILITETNQGMVCAQAGVDASNVPEPDTVALLPADPDRSATTLRFAIRERAGADVAIIISDTFGRPWREGLVNVAIGIDGLSPLLDYRGQTDPQGRPLLATVIAVADELASAAELVMGKLDRVPAALIRGYPFEPGAGRAVDLVRPAEKDLFR